MKKSTKIITAFAILLGMVFAGNATAAYATAPAPSPKYVLALWEWPVGAPKFPQKLIMSIATDSNNVHALDAKAPCGTQVQADLYANDAATAALIAKKVLNGGDESWPVGESQIYNVFTTAPCPVVPVIPSYLATSNTVACGVATITLRNVSPWIYPVSVEVDGVASYGPTVDNRTGGALNGPQKDASATRTITFPEDSGVHTVRYRIAAGSENSLYLGKPVGEWTVLTVQSDCVPAVVTPPVTPPVVAPPTVVPPVADIQLPTPKELAFTGPVTLWMIPFALFLMLFGIGAFISVEWVEKKRQNN